MVRAMAGPPGRLRPRAFDAAFELAGRQVEAGTVPFVTLGIADADGVIRLDSFGPRDGARLGDNASCLLASITKPIVATAVLREVEAGRLDLRAPIALPAAPAPSAGRRPFSAWHVLTHTSGLGDVDVEALLLEGGDRAELLRRAAAVPQETPPGSAFRYASTPWDLLAESIAASQGRSFADVVRENVLEPAGMTHTTFDPAPDGEHPLAPVRVDLPGFAALPQAVLLDAYVRLRLAGGGLWSTAEDVLRFGRAMLRRGELDGARILSPAFLALMTREVTVGGLGAAEDVLRAEHYAIGWGTPGPASPAAPGSFGHGGATGTRLWVDPAHGLVFVYLTGVWEMAQAPIDAVQAAVYAALP
jgi:CubicO group peptidase (beta-lactamase class C family)